ncbi:MAG TPA: hypothetical protein VKV57_10860 [bacterium]|nr:hypothetical protein [bacterium]
MQRPQHKPEKMPPDKQWRVRFEVRHEYPSPAIPNAMVNLRQDLGDRLIDILSGFGLLAILVRVVAQSKEEAELYARKILLPLLPHSGLGYFAITRIEGREMR